MIYVLKCVQLLHCDLLFYMSISLWLDLEEVSNKSLTWYTWFCTVSHRLSRCHVWLIDVSFWAFLSQRDVPYLYCYILCIVIIMFHCITPRSHKPGFIQYSRIWYRSPWYVQPGPCIRSLCILRYSPENQHCLYFVNVYLL